eukprot:2895725-Rhodomonas_salina.1
MTRPACDTLTRHAWTGHRWRMCFCGSRRRRTQRRRRTWRSPSPQATSSRSASDTTPPSSIPRFLPSPELSCAVRRLVAGAEGV